MTRKLNLQKYSQKQINQKWQAYINALIELEKACEKNTDCDFQAQLTQARLYELTQMTGEDRQTLYRRAMTTLREMGYVQ